MSDIINQISARSREQIFSALEEGFVGQKYAPSEDPSVHIKQIGEPLEEIKAKMAENKFEVHEVDGLEQVVDKINEITAALGAKTLIYPKSLSVNVDNINAERKTCFDKPIEELREVVFHTDFSVIDVAFGLVSHGVACVKSSPEQPRMLSLAPNLCIMLLDKTKLERSLDSGLARICAECDAAGKQLPSNILYIAGPSRTSDIELITVFGVHGSQQVHIIFY